MLSPLFLSKSFFSFRDFKSHAAGFLKGLAIILHKARYRAKMEKRIKEYKNIHRVLNKSGYLWCLDRYWSWRPWWGGSDAQGTPCLARKASRSPHSQGPSPHQALHGHHCKTTKRTLETYAVITWDCLRSWALGCCLLSALYNAQDQERVSIGLFISLALMWNKPKHSVSTSNKHNGENKDHFSCVRATVIQNTEFTCVGFYYI